MSREEIIKAMEKSFSTIAPEINFSKIKLDLPLRDQIEVDSLDMYNIVNLLQKKTNIRVSDSLLVSFLNLNDLINYFLKESEVRDL